MDKSYNSPEQTMKPENGMFVFQYLYRDLDKFGRGRINPSQQV